GRRDRTATGVQTCALPSSSTAPASTASESTASESRAFRRSGARKGFIKKELVRRSTVRRPPTGKISRAGRIRPARTPLRRRARTRRAAGGSTRATTGGWTRNRRSRATVGDTSTLAAFERMFDTRGMSAAPSPLTASAEAVTEARALTQRLSRSLGIPTASSLLDQARPRPVLPALARLFARGGLPQGEAVQMSGRSALSLALACCALTTQDGGWCAGIGLGEPAVSAMQDLGVHLPRFVC